MRRLIAFGLFVSACASPGLPPGGPEDSAAPQIIGIAPDSGKVGGRPREVVFRFDEVVSERPAGAPSLNALFLISPRDGAPRVDWNREEIAVRPAKGWRANTTYTVTMLPGMTDLRGNIRNTGARTFFSTGGPIRNTRITGTVWDWGSARTARNALVEAIRLPDSAAYVTIADSAGRFSIEHVPPGRFLLRGIVDENANRGLDPRESWDSVTINVTDSLRADILAFPHDTIAPVIESVTQDDSLRIRVNFDRALDPGSLPVASQFSLKAADSSAVGIVSLVTLRADSVASAAAPPRPQPPRTLVLTLARPLVPGATYRLSATGARGLLGTSSPSSRVVTTPPPVRPPPSAPPPPSRVPPGAGTKADSSRK